jgi:propionyl-CoA carboxylase alpha chain
MSAKKPPFAKILIANRGEIACRVIRSAKRMGIKTVAVYSEADAGALHVDIADEAVAIGPAPASESYLVAEKLIEACKQTGAEAVHPGYGFVSENTAFAKALEKAGIAFIGPPPGAIAAMGDKIESKKLAAKAGVSTVPGYMGVIADAEEAVKIAKEIGFPVMIKASAGGGGKGMRVAYDEREAKDGFRSASNEARSSFGDDRVFIEKFIEEPRHIEIQVLADKHGNTLHLGERECSIQRRHQKVIEEAPSPFLDAETRSAMGEQAKALARAVDYCSAGTVEFIVDKDRNFYFLEMNTRLQVEHPVTEMVTGLDLVECMIRIAAGEKLTLAQEDIGWTGWAIETRVYAEDPRRNFLPSIGRLSRYREPEGEGVRVDSGVFEGAEITMFYDPMIAKLVTYGEDRGKAITRMQRALDSFYIRGINHNMDFLAAVLAQERFRDGRLTTNYIAEEFPDGFEGLEASEEVLRQLIATASVLRFIRAERDAETAGEAVPADWVARVEQQNHPVRVSRRGEDFLVELDGHALTVSSTWQPGDLVFMGRVEGQPVSIQIDRRSPADRLSVGGVSKEVMVLRPHVAELAKLMPVKEPPDLSKFLLSPMPGLLVNVAVEEGQEIKAGEELAVVEAMKMENILRATSDGVVSNVCAQPGDSLAVDQAILEFE